MELAWLVLLICTLLTIANAIPAQVWLIIVLIVRLALLALPVLEITSTIQTHRQEHVSFVPLCLTVSPAVQKPHVWPAQTGIMFTMEPASLARLSQIARTAYQAPCVLDAKLGINMFPCQQPPMIVVQWFIQTAYNAQAPQLLTIVLAVPAAISLIYQEPNALNVGTTVQRVQVHQFAVLAIITHIFQQILVLCAVQGLQTAKLAFKTQVLFAKDAYQDIN